MKILMKTSYDLLSPGGEEKGEERTPDHPHPNPLPCLPAGIK